MEPSATIYSPRVSLRRSIPYVVAGISVLFGGALLGNYVGQQAAARSVAEADWSPRTGGLASVMRSTTLLRGSVVELDTDMALAEKALAEKEQDRVPAARPVIGADSGEGRRKTDFLASLVPTGPVEELFRSRANALPVRLARVSRQADPVELPDQPMFGGLRLPQEVLTDGEKEFVEAPPEPDDQRTARTGDGVKPPSAAKLVAMIERGDVAKANLATYLRQQSAERACLAQAIYFEARSEPTLGQIAVAGVVMNRVNSRKYPNTICGVVFQNDHMKNACQFSFACDGKPDTATSPKHWRSALHMAKAFMDGTKKAHVIRDAMYYHADYVSPDWATRMRVVKKIGRHIFYDTNTRVASR